MRQDQAKYLQSLALTLERMQEEGKSLGPELCGAIAKELRRALLASGDSPLEELENWYERIGKHGPTETEFHRR